MIENVCPELTKNDTCFVVQRYDQGEVKRLDHFHIPNNRLSEDKRVACLRTAVAVHLRDQGYSAEYLANRLAPKRKTSPATKNEFSIVVDNTIAGSYRLYCGGDTFGWAERSNGVSTSQNIVEVSNNAD